MTKSVNRIYDLTYLRYIAASLWKFFIGENWKEENEHSPIIITVTCYNNQPRISNKRLVRQPFKNNVIYP
jgi:hypothetical protein